MKPMGIPVQDDQRDAFTMSGNLVVGNEGVISSQAVGKFGRWGHVLWRVGAFGLFLAALFALDLASVAYIAIWVFWVVS